MGTEQCYSFCLELQFSPGTYTLVGVCVCMRACVCLSVLVCMRACVCRCVYAHVPVCKCLCISESEHMYSICVFKGAI